MADGSPLAHSPTLAATPRGEEQRLEAGTQVGDYVIERFIGAGAMGEVYAGKHPVIGKRVAIKVLRHELAASAEAAERFTREARAVNQIEHENVVDVFAMGRLDDGRLYLVMDLVEGRSLRAHLVDGPLPLERALAILDKVAEALDAAHAKRVVHRDLKPDNIVLSESGKVFVLDFGIAKLITGDGTAKPGTLTGQGTWLGTPGYMAPEQWSADGAGPASDRYALGVIAFELLSGAQPFSASSVPAMMEQHFRAAVPALSSRGAVGLTAIDDVIKRALAKDPEARYPTARAFVDALRAAAGTGVHPARVAVDAQTPRRMWVPAAVGAGVLGIAVVGVLAARSTKDPAKPRAQVAEPTLMVQSAPAGAEIRIGGQVYGKTPKRIDAQPGDTLVVSKPGYLSVRRPVNEERELTVRLDEVTRFNGVWRIGNGELRAFERKAEQVAVYKLDAVAGPKTFFKHYEFAPADVGVAFGSVDEIVDPRAPNDPNCHQPVRVEYRYDPERDTLEQRRENIVFGDSCVVQEREMKSTMLARVDTPSDTLRVEAPVGVPEKPIAKTKRAPKPKTNLPLDPKAAEVQKKLGLEKTVGKKQPPSYTGSKDSFEGQQNAPAQQAQIPPQPQAPPPQPQLEQNLDNTQQAPRQKK